ncbi:MAG: TrkA family potassium uptake protein [Bacillales bacterium]|nr:TrkA family potassium uptake protein [Bacillales bacterium]
MKNILIIGMGKFGENLALKLNNLGDDVCIVDEDADKISALSNKITNAFVADCTNIDALKDLGIKQYDVCVVAIGENFQSSLEITALLKELGAKKIVAKANSDIQSKFLTMAGADNIIYPEFDSAEKLAVICDSSRLFDFISLSDKIGIYEIQAKKSWVGKAVHSLDLRNKYNINIVALKINNDVSIPTADYIFTGEEHLFVIGNQEDVVNLTK